MIAFLMNRCFMFTRLDFCLLCGCRTLISSCKQFHDSHSIQNGAEKKVCNYNDSTPKTK